MENASNNMIKSACHVRIYQIDSNLSHLSCTKLLKTTVINVGGKGGEFFMFGMS